MVLFATQECDIDVSTVVDDTVEIDWPPRNGRRLVIPEIDEARWFGLEEARYHILASHEPLLDRLVLVINHPLAKGV